MGNPTVMLVIEAAIMIVSSDNHKTGNHMTGSYFMNFSEVVAK